MLSFRNSVRILLFGNATILAPENSHLFSNLVLLEVLYLEKSDDKFQVIRVIRYLRNNNVIANEETRKNSIEIYVA